MRLVAFPAASQITETAKDNVWDVGYLAIDPRRANDIDFTAPYLEWKVRSLCRWTHLSAPPPISTVRG